MAVMLCMGLAENNGSLPLGIMTALSAG